VWSGHWWLERCFQQAENPINSPEIIVRTSLQQRVGGYDADLPRAADMEMYMRLAAHADVGFLRGVDQAYYRVHQENMSNSVSALMDLRQRRSVLELALDRYGDGLADREALWAAGRVYDRGWPLKTELARRLIGAGPHEQERDVDELLELAADCWPDIKRLPLYRTLQGRERLRPRDVAYMVSEKGQWWLRRRSWKYRGT
jgi:hypothetical protein